MTAASIRKSARLTHNYLGVFFAPTIVFFAITGVLQIFGLHQTSSGSSYVPPAVVPHLAQLHKKGTLYLPPRKTSASEGGRHKESLSDKNSSDPTKTSTPAIAPGTNTLPIKIFFAATSFALILSTGTGLFLAWRYARRKSIVLLVFLAGVVVPTLLLLL